MIIVKVYNYADELITAARVNTESEIKDVLSKLDYAVGDTIEIESEE